MNGRPGVIVSGGVDANSTLIKSVEFWDASSGRLVIICCNINNNIQIANDIFQIADNTFQMDDDTF